MTSSRILLADDHELVRQGLRTVLESEPGLIVCGEASTGREALAKAIELKPDLLIIDLALPEMNGIEVTRRVCDTLSIPVLIVTMHDSDRLAQEAIDAGASGYVLKADAGPILIAAVRTTLSKGTFVSPSLIGPTRFRGAQGHEDLDHPSAGLTAREREILQLLAEGKTNKEIATALGIATKTAETHRAHIMAKLELHSIGDLVRYAIRNRIIEP